MTPVRKAGITVRSFMDCRTFKYRCARMSDTRPVELVLRLPHEVADSVEEVQQRDPEYLNRVVRYGMVRRAVYRELKRSEESRPPFPRP
jgi:hypothetical protein